MLYLANSLEHALLVSALRVLIMPFEFINIAVSRARPPQRRIPMPPIFAVRIGNDDVRRRREWRRFDCSGDENGINTGQGRSPARAGVRRWSSHTLNGFNHIGVSQRSYCRRTAATSSDRMASLLATKSWATRSSSPD